MNRRDFLKSSVPALAALSAGLGGCGGGDDNDGGAVKLGGEGPQFPAMQFLAATDSRFSD